MTKNPENAFDVRAKKWHNAGRPQDLLETDNWQLLSMYLRRMSLETSATFDAFTQASVDQKGSGWYWGMLRNRHYCSGCYETYRLENLAICINCHNTYCYKCDSHFKRDAKGTRRCACGGAVLG